MANVNISPNMNMPLPAVSQDPGPDWATNLDASLTIVDGHNHTPGSGVQITPQGININADFPMNNNNIITARTLRFFPQGSTPSLPADLGCLYEGGVDLYYIDGSGNNIRLTQSGSPSGATGTITGLPSGTASASFAGTTFTFQSATNTPASLAVGPTTIAQAVPSGFGVTISANGAQASNYNLTLPIALPATQSAIVSDPSGNLSFADFTSFSSGSFTPTGTNVQNVSAFVFQPLFYMQMGNYVTCFGTVDVTANSGTTAIFNMTLPISATLASSASVQGQSSTASANAPGQIYGDAGTNSAQVLFIAPGNLAFRYNFSFSYKIV